MHCLLIGLDLDKARVDRDVRGVEIWGTEINLNLVGPSSLDGKMLGAKSELGRTVDQGNNGGNLTRVLMTEKRTYVMNNKTKGKLVEHRHIRLRK